MAVIGPSALTIKEESSRPGPVQLQTMKVEGVHIQRR